MLVEGRDARTIFTSPGSNIVIQSDIEGETLSFPHLIRLEHHHAALSRRRGYALLLIDSLDGRFASKVSGRLPAGCRKVVDDTGH